MPFRFHLKRASRYDVSSKKSYVICVHLLDKRLIECTLTQESTGYDCLENLAQRIELNEVDYFGLRFENKKLQMRWLELDKPVKKQLDKLAHSPLLYFGLFHYVPDMDLIQDTMTKYQFFLQVKSDIIDGKLLSSTEEAVLLAAHSLQVEFGDHDQRQHTAEFLKDLVILPKVMTADDKSLADLTQNVISTYRTLQGLSATAAELQYINTAKSMEGYGAEYYSVKDESGRDYLLGVSYMGISVKDVNGRPSIYFRWSDIVNLTQNKRVFGINGMGSNRTIEYYMDDTEIAKYVFRLCSLQHQFYKATKTAADNINNVEITGRKPSIPTVLPSPQNTQNSIASTAPPQAVPSQVTPALVPDHTDALVRQTSLTEDSTTDGPQTYELAPQNSPAQNGHVTENHYENIFTAVNNPTQTTIEPQIRASTSLGNLPANVNKPTTQIQAPAYRPAPDYNAVMQQRMEQLSLQHEPHQHSRHMDEVHRTNMTNLSHAQVYNSPELVSQSQPEIGHTPPSYDQHMSQTRLNALGITTGMEHQHRVQTSSYYPSRPVDRSSSLIIHPTYSSPDIAMRGRAPVHISTSENHINNTEALMNQMKPPPPYMSPRSSNSYPDLASQTMRSLYSDSPDLIPHQQNLNLKQNSNLVSLSRFDKSMENLALDAQVLSINQQTATHSKHVLDDASSTQSEYVIQNTRYNTGSYPDVSSNNLYNSQAQLTEVFIVDPSHSQHINSSTQPHQLHHHHQNLPQQQQQQPQQQKAQQMLEQLQREKQEIQRRQELLEEQQRELLLKQSAFSNSESVLSEDTMIVHSPDSVSSPPSTPAFLNPDHLQTLTSPGSTDYSGEEHPQYISPSHFIGTDNPLYRDIDAEDTSLHTPDSSAIPYEGENSVSDMSLSPAVSPASQSSSVANQRQSSPKDTYSNNAVRSGSGRSSASVSTTTSQSEDEDKRLSMGPMKLAALNGLTSVERVLDPIPGVTDDSRIPKDERRKSMENKLEEGQVFVEFEQIPKKRARYDVTVSSQPHNKDRNRFKDVLPYDDNRVKLTPTKANPQGYINASHIRMAVAGKDWWYIAAQGPLPSTILDFWQMIWEQEVEVVAMLTGITEHGRSKCQQYWPDQRGPKHAQKYGDYLVTLKFNKVTGPYVTNGLVLHNKRLKKERLVWHLQYTEWPDHGCPEDPMPFLDYLNALEAIRRQRTMEKRDVQTIPVLVHCSAGVGRTGVTILSELMKACFEYNEVADVPEVLFRLREQRMYMVQTVSQYSFIYQALVQYLKGSRLI